MMRFVRLLALVLQRSVQAVSVVRSACQPPTRAEMEAAKMYDQSPAASLKIFQPDEPDKQTTRRPIELADLSIVVPARPPMLPVAQLYFDCTLTCPCGHKWRVEVWQSQLPCLHVSPCAVCGTDHAQELHDSLRAIERLEYQRALVRASRN